MDLLSSKYFLLDYSDDLLQHRFTLLMTCLFACLVLSCWLCLWCDVMMNTFEDIFWVVSSSSFIQTLWREQAAKADVFVNDEPVCPVESSSAFTFFISPPQRVLSLFKIHIVVSFLGLLVYLCFSRKHGVEYVSGVSRPCYSCNIRYMQWIYSMCTVFPYPWTWLYTCVGMHMLILPRGVLNVAQKMCDTQYIFSCCHFYKVWKNKSFGGYGLGDVRGWYDWLVRSRTVFYWDGQSFLLD